MPASRTFAKPAGWTAFAYAFSGAERGRITIFDPARDAASLAQPGPEPLEVLVMGGDPLSEPIASYGPFVMNSRDEILTAVHDYQAGRMGQVPR